MEILNDFSTSVHRALGEIDPKYMDYPGLVVCGTHAPHDVGEMIQKIRIARETGIPYLGICFGHQLAAIEYARNVMGIKDATSEEFGEGYFVVRRRPEPKIGEFDGESYWSYYDVDLETWKKPPHFITAPFHPEYGSRIDKPHPLLVEYINLCKK